MKIKFAFCDEKGENAGLHRTYTYDINRKVHKSEMMLEDSILLAKLAEGGIISIEAVPQQMPSSPLSQS